MTRETTDLSGALHVLADKESIGAAPAEALLRRGRLAVRHRALGRSVAGIGLAALVGTTAFVAAAGLPHDDAVSPRLRLMKAAYATSSNSFHFAVRGTVTGLYQGKKTRMHNSCTGAADPRHTTGYLATGSGVVDRVVAGDVYVKSGNGWDRVAAPGHAMDYLGCGSVMGKTVVPGTLFAPIKKDGTIRYEGRRGSGAAAVDVYSFAFRWPAGDRRDATTGTVRVRATTGLIEEVSEASTESTFRGHPDTWQRSVTTYSRYGAPVSVERPAAR